MNVINNTLRVSLYGLIISILLLLIVNPTFAQVKMEVEGKIRLANDNSTNEAGDLRYNSDKMDFEGYDGCKWHTFTDKVVHKVIAVGQQTNNINIYSMIQDSKTLTDSSAIIYDSGGPNGDYGSNENKSWKISIPAPQSDSIIGIQITIDSFLIFGTYGYKDSLIIGENIYTQDYNNSSINYLVTELSDNNGNKELLIEFKSKVYQSGGFGFSLRYDIIYGTGLSSEIGEEPIVDWNYSSTKNAIYGGMQFDSNWEVDSIGKNSIQFGLNTKANGENSIAFGQSRSKGNSSIAIGKSEVEDDFGIGIGNNNKSQNSSVALGFELEATGSNSIAIGSRTSASGDRSISIGQQYSLAKEFGSISLNGSALGTNAIAISGDAIARERRSIAIGAATADKEDAVAIGICSAIGEGATALGYLAKAEGNYSVALGNSDSEGTGSLSGVSYSNATGDYSVAFGYQATASGNYSVAIGRNVSTAGYKGAFFFGDDHPTVRSIGQDNQFACRFKGGFYFFTEEGPDVGVRLNPGANSWTSISDSNRKENFLETNGEKILDEFSKIKFGSWNYIGQDPNKFRHYGIMAQDFHKSFGKDSFGTIGDDTSVNPIDMMGVAYTAIKELDKKRRELEKENNELRSKLTSLENHLLKDILEKVMLLERELESIKTNH